MRQLPGTLLLAVLSVLVTFAFLEAVFRLLDLRGFHHQRNVEKSGAARPIAAQIPQVQPLYAPGAELIFRYDSNPRGTFDDDNSLTSRLNNHGFRGRDVSKKKPEGVFRIMVVGDSFTFGEGVRLEDTFVARLEGILRDGPMPAVEVLNFGIGSWGARSEYFYLVKEGLQFEPDLVLLVFTPNDAEYAGGLDLWTDFREAYEAPGALKHSYFASWVYARVNRTLVGRRYIEELVASALGEHEKWRRTLGLVSRLEQVTRFAGSDYAIAIFPFMFELDEDYPLAAIHELVAETARAAGTPCLDLLPAFFGHAYTDLWVHPSDQHPNEVAHAIAASAIARFLVAEKLLGPGR
jgi:hypothetical protein